MKYIVFDLDDTLCDYQSAKRNAVNLINQILATASIDVDQFWNHYRLVEPKLFRQFLDKTLSKEQYRLRRYADILQESHENALDLALKLNIVYMQEANRNIQLFEDAVPLIQSLKQKGIRGAILTNGPSDGQRDKLEALKLLQYINRIYISEEIGFSKPSSQAFEFVLQDLGIERTDMIFVGDSLEDDVEGAKRSGIIAILIDRDNRYPNYADLKVKTLLDLSTVITLIQ